MTKKSQLAIELSEKREKINALLGLPDGRTDDRTAKRDCLRADRVRLQEIGTGASRRNHGSKKTEQTVSTGEGTAEDRELRTLRERVGITQYIEAASEKRAVDGAELEFNQALKIGAHKFPLEILAPVEERATTDADTAVGVSRWLDRLFSSAAASRLGVTFESVSSGAASYPVITAGASGAQRGRKEAAAVAAWTVGVTELKPTRNAVHAVFSREDDLRNPGLQDALTRDLRMALVDSVDLAVFEGDAGANEDAADITGLQTAANVAEETITQAGKIKGADVLSELSRSSSTASTRPWAQSFVRCSLWARNGSGCPRLRTRAHRIQPSRSSSSGLVSSYPVAAVSTRQPQRGKSARSLAGIAAWLALELPLFGIREC